MMTYNGELFIIIWIFFICKWLFWWWEGGDRNVVRIDDGVCGWDWDVQCIQLCGVIDWERYCNVEDGWWSSHGVWYCAEGDDICCWWGDEWTVSDYFKKKYLFIYSLIPYISWWCGLLKYSCCCIWIQLSSFM